MELGRFGVWWSGTWRVADAPTRNVPAELESLGYGALWSSGGFDPGLSPHFAALLNATEHVAVASGIVSIWRSSANEIADAAAVLEQRHPGRFVLGLGVSHAPLADDYRNPVAHMVRFLDDLDAAAPGVPTSQRMLAALGPRMLEMAAQRAAGAHPYLVPVEHTALARRVLGPDPVLAPEVTVVLERDPAAARALARRFVRGYLTLPNYTNNLRRLGFGDADVAGEGSDRLVDALVAWGDVDAVAARVHQHHEVGADHVCVQILSGSPDSFPVDEYRVLAGALMAP